MIDAAVHVIDDARPGRTLCGVPWQWVRAVPARTRPSYWDGCRDCLKALERMEEDDDAA